MKQIEILELDNKLDDASLISFLAETCPDVEMMLKSPLMNQSMVVTPVKNMACLQFAGLVPPLSEWTERDGAHIHCAADGKTTLFQVGDRFYSVKRFRGRTPVRTEWNRVA